MESDSDESLNQIFIRAQKVFPEITLKERYMDLLTFYITTSDLKWSKIFGEMMQIKTEIDSIKDFTITQMSLEQVFLFFTRDGHSELAAGHQDGSMLI